MAAASEKSNDGAKTAMAFWNDRTIVSPPVCALTGSESLDKEQLYELKQVLREAMRYLEDECYPMMASELYILAKFIYKANSQFRREKFLAALHKVKRCVERVSEVDIHNIIGRFAEMLPSDHELLFPKAIHLPSRQMLEHLLVRLTGVAHLMKQMANYCMEAYHHILQLLAKGLFVPNMLLYGASVSRIWILSYSALKLLSRSYGLLSPWRDVLNGTQVEWLPKGVELPATLDELAASLKVPKCTKQRGDSIGDITVGDLMKVFDDNTTSVDETGEEQGMSDDDDEGMPIPSKGDKHICFTLVEDEGLPVQRRIKDMEDDSRQAGNLGLYPTSTPKTGHDSSRKNVRAPICKETKAKKKKVPTATLR